MSRRGLSTGRLAWALVAMIAVFMTGTVVVALGQEDIGWGWWWAVPVGGLFLLAVIGFRVLVQRSQEAAEREDQSSGH
ncbi:hypothetical protein H5399_06470 [Tessaracoccus sp. MC1627]|uniref:hypothetical protein n=1 Tax=Tessaracoccus sp. MC1627 TaxID=2760312 RepID=UPI00160073B7|nr:hypothetical protein [Tessaracoccus sp. MC1627]MBB1512248.1 hypothetical protein [Tessaracoccus sp. MC1627]